MDHICDHSLPSTISANHTGNSQSHGINLMGVFAVTLQTLACLGYGAAILRFTNVQLSLRDDEQIAWALGLGTGVVGWFGFILGVSGHFSNIGYLLLLVAGLLSTVFAKDALVQCWQTLGAWRPTKSEGLCLIMIGLFAVCFLSNALIPPTNADSLAYHFYLPKYFNSLGHLEFVPRAIDGTSPMLPQMAYLPVYGLGGELAMTLWVMINGWIAAFLLFSLCRRYVSITWSLTVVLLFISVPAYVYGAGSGQVEVRIAIFVMIAAFSLSAAIQTGLLRHVIICAIAIGFFMASKYTGLIFAFACGIIIVIQKRGLVHGLVLTIISVSVGCQWYIWNATHTGDPVFPMLFETLVNHVDYKFWDARQNKLFVDNFLTTEKVLDPSILNFFRFPFVATFSDLEGLEASRTGFGPYIIMVIPFSIVGLWVSRKDYTANAILTVAMLIVVFYTVWFFVGSPQRVRHLLPIYPLALIIISIAAISGAKAMSSTSILAFGISVTLIIQLGGTALYSIGSIKHLVSDESREQFLSQRISNFSSVAWINQRLKPTDRVYIEQRELAYLINAPVYSGHPFTQVLIQPQAKKTNSMILRNQLFQQGITHLLVPNSYFGGNTAFSQLLARGCVEILKNFNPHVIQSRTLNTIGVDTGAVETGIYSAAIIQEEAC